MSVEEAVEAAEEIGLPVVLKVDSPDIPHRMKTDGVEIDLQTVDQVKQAYGKIMRNVSNFDENATINGILVQDYVEGGVEAMVGVVQDPGFGPLVTVATGGTLVEVLDDSSFRLPPVLGTEARDMIDETHLGELVSEQLGHPDRADALASIITKVGDLAVEVDSIAEMDLNPILLTSDEAVALDVMIRT
jgi:acyl-CoA synthetase (NDP forming)